MPIFLGPLFRRSLLLPQLIRALADALLTFGISASIWRYYFCFVPHLQ
jgi:hypothetical protein